MTYSHPTAENIKTEIIDNPLPTQTLTGTALISFTLGQYTISPLLRTEANHIDAFYRFFDREDIDRQNIFYETFGMNSADENIACNFFDKNGKFNIYAIWEGNEIRGVMTRFYADDSNPETSMRLSPFASSAIKGTGVMGQCYKALAETIRNVEGILLGYGMTAEKNMSMRRLFEDCGLNQQWIIRPEDPGAHPNLKEPLVVYGI